MSYSIIVLLILNSMQEASKRFDYHKNEEIFNEVFKHYPVYDMES